MATTYTPIATYTVSGTSTTSVTFSSLGSYTDLVLTANFSGNYTSNDRSQLLARFNGSSTGYSSMAMTASTVGANTGTYSTSNGNAFWSLATMPLSNSSTIQKNFLEWYIGNYGSSTLWKQSICKIANVNSANNTPNITIQGLCWASTSPVTSITIYEYSNLYYFYAGCTFALYGITKA